MTAIRSDLDQSLMDDYGLTDLDAFRASHKPFHWYVEFNSVLANGGFDVIVGNPPYVEYKTVKGEYSIRGFATEDCGDLYGYVMERSTYIQRSSGRFGMIVPVSIVSTDKFDSVRKLLLRDRKSWVASFAERPSKLFEGVEKRLTTWIRGSSTSTEVYISHYRRWLSEEREFLMATQSYVRGSDAPRLLGSSIPKIETDYESAILRRLSRENRLKVYFKKTSSHVVYYTRKLRYFVQFFDFVPKITDTKGGEIPPSELKEIYLPSDDLRYIAIAVLNSGLFFWFMTAHSDVRNLNKREIEEFPCSIDRISPDVARQLIELGHAVTADFQDNSRVLSNNYGKYGVLNIQSFQPRLSKPIIDEIDRVLARHYGFTEAELDFIIHYDIKYRMGRDAESEDDNGDE
ncbi:MAG: Eco57I restriction-modification methylase domain-containing protein [Chloroflexi bacterium]|nr:Eco57I restriction-modification methylase domain-containing protein [Chloroflexota bacterium]